MAGRPTTCGSNLAGDLTYNPNNRLTNVGNVQKIWDVNPSVGGPIVRDKVWFNFTYRHWGVNKSVADSFTDADPSPFRYVAEHESGRRRRPHRQLSAGRVAWQISQKDKVSIYHDDQSKYRDHWGISATCRPKRPRSR